MSDERFVCIDIGYGDEWYITDNGERLSGLEIVDLLNKQQDTIITLKRRALNNNDKDLFESADRIEHELKLLMDKNTIFERW